MSSTKASSVSKALATTSWSFSELRAFSPWKRLQRTWYTPSTMPPKSSCESMRTSHCLRPVLVMGAKVGKRLQAADEHV